MTRILIHVQHLLGTGHLQRAALIARALDAAGAEVLLVTGGMLLPGLAIGRGHILQLPPLRATDASFKLLVGPDGQPLGDAGRETRRRLVLGAFTEFRPDLVLTETYPFGRGGLRFELEPLVAAVKAAEWRPRLVASIRDILVAKSDPAKRAKIVTILRAAYDRVLVHADPRLVQLAASFPEAELIDDLISYTGFVAPAPPVAGPDTPSGEVVVSAGGGVAGEALLRAALAARPLSRHRAAPWRLITGRNLPDAAFADLVATAPAGVTIERFRPDLPALFTRAALSISQAGYNTAVELLHARVPAVLVPFAEAAETEQTLRARLFADQGFASMVEAADLSPESLAAAIDRAGPPPIPDIDLGGAAGSAAMLMKLAHR
jgi:predicted glycosyltransferase